MWLSECFAAGVTKFCLPDEAGAQSPRAAHGASSVITSAAFALGLLFAPGPSPARGPPPAAAARDMELLADMITVDEILAAHARTRPVGHSCS